MGMQGCGYDSTGSMFCNTSHRLSPHTPAQWAYQEEVCKWDSRVCQQFRTRNTWVMDLVGGKRTGVLYPPGAGIQI